tara:strand:- start:6016 stop:6393 length:378 start_codon:yes stop_codon:yes gene_type:complete
MPSKEKRKGTYHEKAILKWLKEIGFPVKKQILSGSLVDSHGQQYRGDLILDMPEMNIRVKEKLNLYVEVKYRDASSFPNAFSVLEGRDIAFFKRRKGTPKTCVIIDGDIFESIVAPQLLKKRNKK